MLSILILDFRGLSRFLLVTNIGQMRMNSVGMWIVKVLLR